MKKPATLTADAALKKLERYCDWQERCKADVINKLYAYNLPPGQHEDIIKKLESEGFLNEKRYASAFVRGKFNQNKWGRLKIRNALAQKGVSETHIQDAMQEIPETKYTETLNQLLRHKYRQVKDKDPFKKTMKVKAFLAQKGFEIEVIHEAFKSFEREIKQ